MEVGWRDDASPRPWAQGPRVLTVPAAAPAVPPAQAPAASGPRAAEGLVRADILS